ncbi:hypothetical protein D3C74_305110 [compost metagenome]
MMPKSVAGIAMAKMVPKLTPRGAINPIMAAVAADTGEQVIACWEAIILLEIGLSGLILLSMASSLMTGNKLYTTCPVPDKNVNSQEMTGAMMVIFLGDLLSIFSARYTRKLSPPEDCSAEAAKTTAKMINMTSMGGAAGWT